MFNYSSVLRRTAIRNLPYRCLNLPIRQISTQPALSLAAIAPGSDHHHDLSSFLAYAERNELNRERTVFVGTHYEYTVLETLKQYGFKLVRTGRARDKGIDLIGYWHAPGTKEPLKVILQCKCVKAKISPSHVREMVGAFSSVPAEWKKQNVFGLIVSPGSATSNVHTTIRENRKPMGVLKINIFGQVEQFTWNRTAVKKGLKDVATTPRYLSEAVAANGGVTKDLVLTWKGFPYEPTSDLWRSVSKEESEEKIVQIAKAADEQVPEKKRTRRKVPTDEGAAVKKPRTRAPNGRFMKNEEGDEPQTKPRRSRKSVKEAT